MELKLSDAFEEPVRKEGCLEFKALVLNINLDHNKELMERCQTLKEYAIFVSRVRDHLCAGRRLEEAVDCSVDDCIREGVLAGLLSKHRAEVRDMILTEYDEQKHMEMERRDAKAEGRMEGKAEGILLLLSDKGKIPEALRSRIKSEEDMGILNKWLLAAARAGSVEEFEEKMGHV